RPDDPESASLQLRDEIAGDLAHVLEIARSEREQGVAAVVIESQCLACRVPLEELVGSQQGHRRYRHLAPRPFGALDGEALADLPGTENEIEIALRDGHRLEIRLV